MLQLKLAIIDVSTLIIFVKFPLIFSQIVELRCYIVCISMIAIKYFDARKRSIVISSTHLLIPAGITEH